MKPNFEIDQNALADFCRKNRINKLALFGSVLREDFGPESDIDVLVEFEEGFSITLFQYIKVSHDLGDTFFPGRRVDLVTYKGIKPSLKPIILSEARVQYEQAA